MRQSLVFFLLLFSGLLGLFFSLFLHQGPKATSDIQTIETFHYPALFVSQLRGDRNAGEKIFKEFCTVCHGKNPSIDVNAPRIGDKNAWKSRKNLKSETLLKITIEGVGAMPARGGCFECSDQQLLDAIRYLIN